MENADYYPRLLPVVLERGLLDEEPFVLVDVGCGTGPDPLWRLFGEALHMHGFDANVEEVERLARVEENPNVHYRAALVGLPDGHPFFAQQEADRRNPAHAYFNPWPRISTTDALKAAWKGGDRSLVEANAWAQHRLATEKITLDDFVEESGLGSVDFVKVDTDGADLEVLHSAERTLAGAETSVLGLLVETPFVGAAGATENSFHNIDRLLRGHGFALYGLTVNRYSRAALPSRFAYRMYAQTEHGQALWADALYLRDPAAPGYLGTGGPELSPRKLLKLACLQELFCLPDCAAEVLLAFRAQLEPLLDVDEALDLLTPQDDGLPATYPEYVAAFERDPASFFPPVEESWPVLGEPAPDAPPRDPMPTTRVALRALGFRFAIATWSHTPEPVRARLRGVLRLPPPSD